MDWGYGFRVRGLHPRPGMTNESSHRVEPAEVDREALAGQQRRSFVQRQADDVGVGADDLDDEAAGEPLRGVATGLVAPLTGGEIGLNVLLRQPLEAHPRLDQPL